jgi:DNA mismatch repair ATPase MutL
MKMNTEKIKEAYNKYGLDKDDVFRHQHYIIITRSGIEKIQAIEQIHLDYEIVKCEKDFCVIKAHAKKDDIMLQTFGSALKGDFKSGTTNSWYVVEMAEKRAMSRAVLKMTGLYELGIFGEDESEDFKRK